MATETLLEDKTYVQVYLMLSPQYLHSGVIGTVEDVELQVVVIRCQLARQK